MRRVRIGGDTGRGFDGLGAEQPAGPPQQGAHLIELLLKHRFSHACHATHAPSLPQFTELGAVESRSDRFRGDGTLARVGIFGRRTARRRLRKAARQSLATPPFSPPIDSTPWVLGGLWPAELAEITTQNAAVAEYLNADLQRIANSANERIQELRQANLTAVARQAEEERVIKAAREFAVLRVESTVRAMRSERPAPDERGAVDGTTTVLRPPPARAEPEVTKPEPEVTKPEPEAPNPSRSPTAPPGRGVPRGWRPHRWRWNAPRSSAPRR
ncbi:hypothetical protein C1Y40_00047 [Mycobacterium talmoniae]|uniref:Uncharacterized protein n=1 Tax=Mycobacterium talmoniae TaxID=1858794 RepID=A0A2S8BSW5_9MYCO|nr:hypothetical protein C1Y40_00047 [Mycobacterium talmoniae]